MAVVNELTTVVDDQDSLTPFRLALDYLQGGRDPYLLAALSPELRRAVELVVEEFDSGAAGEKMEGAAGLGVEAG